MKKADEMKMPFEQRATSMPWLKVVVASRLRASKSECIPFSRVQKPAGAFLLFEFRHGVRARNVCAVRRRTRASGARRARRRFHSGNGHGQRSAGVCAKGAGALGGGASCRSDQRGFCGQCGTDLRIGRVFVDGESSHTLKIMLLLRRLFHFAAEIDRAGHARRPGRCSRPDE
jgi:hypothetical protein